MVVTRNASVAKAYVFIQTMNRSVGSANWLRLSHICNAKVLGSIRTLSTRRPATTVVQSRNLKSSNHITSKTMRSQRDKKREKETEDYIRTLSVQDLKDLQGIFRNYNHATIRAVVKSMRFKMKSERQGDVDLNVDSKAEAPLHESKNAAKPPRHPIGMLRNERVLTTESDMEITFLGTASACPSLTRGVSCTALKFKSEVYLFDCGEATQLQFMYSTHGTRKVNKIFITHMHGDHVFGLPAMLCGIGSIHNDRVNNDILSPEDLEGYVVDIYGPEGIRDYIRHALYLTKSKTTVPFRVHELKNIPIVSPHLKEEQNGSDPGVSGKGGDRSRVVPVPMANSLKVHKFSHADFGEVEGSTDIFPDATGVYHLADEELSVKAAPLAHTIPCVGYVVEEKSRVGTLRIDRLQPFMTANEEGLKKQYGGKYRSVLKTIKSLKEEESFTFPNGVVIYGRDVVEPAIEGRKVVILGDTCNSERIAPIAMNADVLIHEATVNLEELSAYVETSEAKKRRHSSAWMAGKFAERINAKQLLMTHFSRRCSGNHDLDAMKFMWHIEDLARRGVPRLSGGNDIIAAWDFMTVSIPNKTQGRDYLKNYEGSSSCSSSSGGGDLKEG